MGGNIPGGDFLGGNFPRGIFHGGSLMSGNFPGGNFPRGNFPRTTVYTSLFTLLIYTYVVLYMNLIKLIKYGEYRNYDESF